MSSFTKFGTAHEELEDEQNTAITRRPKRIEEEIVTDEKGRRRFHGAFTGGFSAGYFNTVGSKLGWEPQTFKSTRGEKTEKYQSNVSDFMDEEDRGEHGFAAQKIKVRDDFMEKIAGGDSRPGQSALAWERSEPSASTASVGISDLALHLEKTIYAVSDSVGVRILKRYGWRPGKGIGPRMNRRALERQKVNDARSRGEAARFDEKAVRDVEELAPDIEFAPDDIPRLFFQSNDSQHGIGYKPLEHSNVLDESFGHKVSALKTKMKSRGIRGQAFGVGAFEEEDDDIYTSEDLSKYDYAIGGDASQNFPEIERYDSRFIAAVEVERPVCYNAPQPTRHFCPRHRAEPIILKDLPEALATAVHHLTPLQKAVFLGDRSGSIMELLSDSDRQKLELLSRKAEKEVQLDDDKKRKEEKRRGDPEPFEEEPLKAHRFKKYVHYLKSGYDMSAPLELTQLEWERELSEFQAQLTPELRSLLPDVRSRQAPLANLKTAQPIADLLKNRFRPEDSSLSVAKPESRIEIERKEAVKQKRFGDMTRTKYKWHPSKLLCKYFNIEDPYPGSQMVGSYELQRQAQKPQMSVQIDSLNNLGLPNTQRDVIERLGREVQDRRLQQQDESKRTRWESDVEVIEKRTFTVVEKPVFLPPVELLQSVFELPVLEESSSSSDSETEQGKFELDRDAMPAQKPKEHFITINDILPDDNVYGPRIPESLPDAIPVEEKIKITPIAPHPEVVTLESSDESTDGDYHRSSKKRRRSEGRKKEKHRHKSKHKDRNGKPKKSKKRRRNSPE